MARSGAADLDRLTPAPGAGAACARRRTVRYRLGMTIVQTVLVFIGIPAAIIAALAFAVYGKSMLHQPNRYRPGRPWNYQPAWFVPHPDAVVSSAGAHRQVEGSTTSTTAVGGASGEW